ncbi:hypothetical protein [Streptomyces muensis]|uniref:Secreted protein n=1 Tax=Streptomyces muensis TaxID=1077944 RepID=A0A9X1PTJ4_STRM4|nr:hypothetical protein [Streptomyces muensis]MCF1593212.1 hypothetical protein [Streptomyces muensis]
MTRPGAWARAALIALLAAFAVLVHHESPAVPVGPAASPAAHVMTPAGHESAAARAAEPIAAALSTAISAHGPACDGMPLQHCSTASLEVVKLAPPARSPAPQDPAAHEAVTSGATAAGTVGRAPPDLSVLSQLRI